MQLDHKPPGLQVKSRSRRLNIDHDIGHIELGVVDYASLTVVSASRRFYEWIDRPLMARVSLVDLIADLEVVEVHQALEAFDGVCEIESDFMSRDGSMVRLRIRLLKTGSSAVSPLKMLAFDISELRRKEEVLRTVSKLLESHKAIISESRKTLKVLLDSLPQAVFLVDASLHITSEISKKAEQIFGQNVEYAPLWEVLMCSEDALEPLQLAFSGVGWDMMVGILPSEYDYDGRNFSLGFIPIYEHDRLSCVTVVVTDVTERRKMEQSLEQTDADNRALVAILSSKEEFIDLLNLSRKAGDFTDDLYSFRSIIHGLKGGFSFLDCDKLVGMCHRAESNFVPEIYTPEIGTRFMRELKAELRSFTNRFRHVLQIDSRADVDISSRHLQVDYDAIGALYVQAAKESASPALLSSIEHLVELPVEKLLGWLDKAWLKTLQGEAKYGTSITWSGDVNLAREPYRELFQSFLHIIRNSADHGIESPEVRERLGKPRAGAMHIELSYADGVYRFSFEDDGAGIDPDKLVAIARSRGLFVPEGVSREEALMLICEPGFSSRSEVTALSGRGIGVDAVRRAAKLCGGDVSVESVSGEGTKISVWFKRQRYWR
jgi:two-component system chemotaxis sensor kinase CheA